MNTIRCPKCNQAIEIDKAFQHELKGQIEQELELLHKKELEKAKQQALLDSSKKIKEQFAFQLKQLEEDRKEKDERNKELQEQITKLFEEVRQSKREKDEAKLVMQKKLAEEEEKIRIDATKKAEQEQHLKILQKEKQLQDAIKANEELRRKLQQGSQQTQGEVLEQEFEEILRREFPNDKIEEVAKGTRGGDIIQHVWDSRGNMCGKILWELKNTKNWSEQWIDKVRIDQRAITADYAVIISEVVPPEVNAAKFYKNVWVTKREFVISIACALRINLIQIAMARRAAEGTKEKKDILFSYLSGIEFRLRIEAIVEAFTNMQSEIEKEKRYFANKWARDEKNIRQVIDSTYGMHGELKGIMGNVLPQIKGLELLEDTVKSD